jgi:hypothetical protein
MTYWRKELRNRLKRPRGPRGEKRPADVIGAAVMVARIATGEVEEKLRDPSLDHTPRSELERE